MAHLYKTYNNIKCVVIGDGGVGKTSLLISYATNKFPQKYVPTIFDNYAVSVRIGIDDYTLALFDTAGQEEYEKLRPLSYPETDVFVVCFAITYPPSMENVKSKWVPELKRYCPRTPFILVGTQEDARYSPDAYEKLGKNMRPIRQEEGIKMANDIKAVKYVECSALTQKNVKTVFDEAILAALNGPPPPKKKKACTLL